MTTATPKLRAPRPGETLTWIPKRASVVITPRKPAPQPSASQLRLIVAGLLAEAAAATDPGLQSRLYEAAGRADMRARTAEARERPSQKPLDRAQIDKWVAAASEMFPAAQ